MQIRQLLLFIGYTLITSIARSIAFNGLCGLIISRA